jgi:hypothetical protein
MFPQRGSDEEKLNALLQAYKAACPDRDASANFMPALWQRIEARQSFSFSFFRMASGFVTAALALSIALGVYMSLPHTNSTPYYSQSYVEAVADANSSDLVFPVRLDVQLPAR